MVPLKLVDTSRLLLPINSSSKGRMLPHSLLLELMVAKLLRIVMVLQLQLSLNHKVTQGTTNLLHRLEDMDNKVLLLEQVQVVTDKVAKVVVITRVLDIIKVVVIEVVLILVVVVADITKGVVVITEEDTTVVVLEAQEDMTQVAVVGMEVEVVVEIEEVSEAEEVLNVVAVNQLWVATIHLKME